MKSDKQRDKLVTIKVKSQTFFHLRKMAAMAGYQFPGMVVDKLVRSIQVGELATKGRPVDGKEEKVAR